MSVSYDANKDGIMIDVGDETALCTNLDNEKTVDDGTGDESVLESTISLSSSQILSTPCGGCGKLTTKKDRVFECSKCKVLTHYTCSKLPGYFVYLIKSSTRKYVCAACSDPPDEFIKLYDSSPDDETITTKEVVHDVFQEIKRVADSVAKFDLERMAENLQEKLKILDQVDDKIEKKVKAMEARLVDKLNEKLSESPATESACSCVTNTAMQEEIKRKESEISLLNEEFTDADKKIRDLTKKNVELNETVKSLQSKIQSISNNLRDKTSAFDVLKTKHDMNENAVGVSNNEIKNLKVFITDRDKHIQVLQNDKGDLSTKLQELIKQFDELKTVINSGATVGGDRFDNDATDQATSPDIVILNDSLYKAVKSEGLMKREKQKVLMKWSPKLEDAKNHVVEMQEKPKVVLLHCGTNDLDGSTENHMLECVQQIYDVLHARGIKLIFNFILPRADEAATVKAEIFNIHVVQLLAGKEDAHVGRNHRFYWNGFQSERLFDEDGVHVNEAGTKELVTQTKIVLCRALGIEQPRQHGRNNFRGRGGRSRGSYF